VHIKEKYKLELHWDEIVYHNDSSAVLKGARFQGPALKIAQKIGAPDSIDIDLTPQHFVVLDSYYIVRLQWAAVNYLSDGTVMLQEAVLSNGLLKQLHKLNNKDFIIVDTYKHEEETHPYNLVYASYVVREDGEKYNYTK